MIKIYAKLENLPEPPPDGTYAVIDVLRFSTTACTAMEQGASVIRPVGSTEEAFQYQSERDDVILSGERNGTKIVGFDTGNSPEQIESMDLTDRELICLTSNGTRALQKLKEKKGVIASTTNAEAAATYLSDCSGTIHLVACGSSGEASDEDRVGAELIKQYLVNKPPSEEEKQQFQQRIREASHAVYLQKIGFAGDVERATEFNSQTVVPEFSNGTIHSDSRHGK